MKFSKIKFLFRDKLNIYILLVVCCSFLSCTKGKNQINNTVNNTAIAKGVWWKPQAGVTFDWLLDNPDPNVSFSSDVVDVDAFETPIETISALHALGKKVIAYVSVGTIEGTRPDGNLLPSGVVGKVYPEWPDEKWVDIRQISKIKPWLLSRFSMISNKKFDAIEPDNLDGYSNDSGFNLTILDEKKFCDSIITYAHLYGLGIGQKNLPEFSAEFSEKFDWALTEDAYNQGWAKDMMPYIDKKKPVFIVEYTDMMSQQIFDNTVCTDSKKRAYSAILKNRNLDKWSHTCR